MIAPLPVRPSDDRLVAVLADAGEVARAALSRLFSPGDVQLRELRVGPDVEPLPLGSLRVSLDLEGPVTARLIVSVSRTDGLRLGDALLRRAAADTGFDEHAAAALTEMANIAASSFLSRLALAARRTLVPTVPALEPASASDAALGVDWFVTARYAVTLPAGVVELSLHAAPDHAFLTALREGPADGRG